MKSIIQQLEELKGLYVENVSVIPLREAIAIVKAGQDEIDKKKQCWLDLQNGHEGHPHNDNCEWFIEDVDIDEIIGGKEGDE